MLLSQEESFVPLPDVAMAKPDVLDMEGSEAAAVPGLLG